MSHRTFLKSKEVVFLDCIQYIKELQVSRTSHYYTFFYHNIRYYVQNIAHYVICKDINSATVLAICLEVNLLYTIKKNIANV